MANKGSVTVVVPLHNEQSIFSENVEFLKSQFDDIFIGGNWHFMFIDNASTDQTPQLMENYKQRFPKTQCLYEPGPNYGRALRKGLINASTEWVHSIDIEQWDIPFIRWAWMNRAHHDLFIASKRADPTLNYQTFYRHFLSWGLNAMINLMLDYSGSDTHGPKLLRMSAMRSIIEVCQMSRGQFDVEFVIRAFRQGLSLLEAPVEYVDTRPPRTLMLMKIYWNIREFLRLRRILKAYPYNGPVRLYRISRQDMIAAASVRQETNAK